MRNIGIIVLLILSFTNCTESDSTVLPEELRGMENLTVYSIPQNPDTVALVQEQIYVSTDTTIVGNMVDVAVDTDGTVYIADSDQNVIHSYQQDGTYVTSIGREGGGPGEFRSIGDLKILSNQLYAHARQSQRIYIYSLSSNEYMGQISLNPQNWNNVEDPAGVNSVSTFYPLNEDRLLVAISEFTSPENQLLKYYWVNSDGKVISDKLLEQKKAVPTIIQGQTPIVFTLPFTSKPLLAVSSEGNLYSARTDDFLMKLYDRTGNYKEAFYYPYERSQLNKDNFLNRYPTGPFRQGVSRVDFPDTWPALNSMFIDDEDRLWVSTILDDQEVYQWWILDPQGTLLARFRWPRNKPVQMIRNGFFYTRETNEKTGIEEIVRYSITGLDSEN